MKLRFAIREFISEFSNCWLVNTALFKCIFTFRLLGQFDKAASDLRESCKIDCDEQAQEWLAEVTPNADKLRAHNLNVQRRQEEKEVIIIISKLLTGNFVSKWNHNRHKPIFVINLYWHMYTQ